MRPRVRGIEHLNLIVRDLDRSRTFYEQLLGFERAFAKGTTVWLSAGDDLLGLSQGEPPAQKPNHFGFRVDARAEVDDWAAWLTRAGVGLEKGPYDRSDGRSFYFRDPDGYILEIFCVDPSFLSPSRN
jgi:catechol 2,3-dioxygenase-like lactoylglutathione lyase family enzyme